MRKGKGKNMKKANLYIEPIERDYIEKYKERTDTTQIKLKQLNIPNDMIADIIQLRMDNIFLRKKLAEKTAQLTAIGANPFENPT